MEQSRIIQILLGCGHVSLDSVCNYLTTLDHKITPAELCDNYFSNPSFRAAYFTAQRRQFGQLAGDTPFLTEPYRPVDAAIMAYV